ncbi:tannase/feruloyl esterase family alpha/beta hydrolase, partial [Streptomyces sp. NPDC058157]
MHLSARLRRAAAAAAALVTIAAWPAAAGDRGAADRGAAATADGHCAGMSRLRVPGAELQVPACLDELTTAGTVASGHTDPADWAGLTPAGLSVPGGVPGI